MQKLLTRQNCGAAAALWFSWLLCISRPASRPGAYQV